MSSQDKEVKKEAKNGADQTKTIDLTNISFSPDGELQGGPALPDDVLDTMAGGLTNPAMENINCFNGC